MSGGSPLRGSAAEEALTFHRESLAAFESMADVAQDLLVLGRKTEARPAESSCATRKYLRLLGAEPH